MKELKTVSIKFKPGTYAVFRNLQNKLWYAMGEYVDNAVQSYIDNHVLLNRIHGGKYQFEVRINIDREKDVITIYDNAAGISRKNFPRAFEPANIPIDSTGLHEFGMGMKTASIWLSESWTVRTKSIHESVERFVEFDLQKVLKEEKEILKVHTARKNVNEHYTEITLKGLTKNAPNAYQMSKLKSHLACIYRSFIRTGKLQLFIDDIKLNYKDPEILIASPVTNPSGQEVLWKKEINIKHGKFRATGFIALLNELSTSEHNGLSLFRRGRVIEGSHDEKYRPKIICGQIGSFRYKRLFGELELSGFDVSFNKGSFQDQGDIENFMELIKRELSQKNFNLLKQADDYRKPKVKEEIGSVAKLLVNSIKKEKSKASLKDKVTVSIKEIENKSLAERNNKHLKAATPIDFHEDSFTISGIEYVLKMELINERKVTDLYSLAIEKGTGNKMTAIYKINLRHPFFARFEHFKKNEEYKPVVLIIKSLVMAEIHSQHQGTKHAGNVRTNFNTFLRNI